MSDYSKFADGELLNLMAGGDQKAFDELYNRYWKRVLSVAVHRVQDVPEAEGIVQDIFLSLWRRRKELEISSDLGNYLLASVKYRVIKHLNKQSQKRLYEERHFEQINLLDDSTQEYLDFSELRKRLEELVGQLPDACRLVYKLNKEDGMSYKEIADHLGISEKAVDGHLFRAKKALKLGLKSFLSIYLL